MLIYLFLAHDSSTGAKNLELRITRSKLDELIGPIVERCKHSITKALEDAKLTNSDINKICDDWWTNKNTISKEICQ